MAQDNVVDGPKSPMEVFGEEDIWRNIFANLEDPQDRLNLMRSNKELAELFEEDKNEWLLPAVIPLVCKIIDHPNKDMIQDRKAIQKGVLGLRELSSKCCQGVNAYINQIWDPKKRYCSGIFRLTAEVDRDRKYLQQMNNVSMRAPPLIRKIGSRRDINSENGATEQDVINMVTGVGRNLLKVWLRIVVLSYPLSRAFAETLLSLCPNLEAFYLCFDFPSDPEGRLIPPLEMEEDRGLRLLPDLPNLKCLTVVSFLDPAIFSQYFSFGQYFPQLQEMGTELYLLRNTPGNFTTELKTLWLRLNWEEISAAEETCRNIPTFWAPNLKKLEVICDRTGERPDREELQTAERGAIRAFQMFLERICPNRAFQIPPPTEGELVTIAIKFLVVNHDNSQSVAL